MTDKSDPKGWSPPPRRDIDIRAAALALGVPEEFVPYYEALLFFDGVDLPEDYRSN
jgi:hypothetical protein